jgi:hypothetical protein
MLAHRPQDLTSRPDSGPCVAGTVLKNFLDKETALPVKVYIQALPTIDDSTL